MSTAETFNTNLPSMHHKHSHPAVAAVGSRIYGVQGYGAGGSQSTAEWYMRTKWCCTAAVSLGNNIIVIGGFLHFSAEQYKQYMCEATKEATS
eukprot:3938461-Ditylum_brightwellii.AAC.1